MSYNEQHALKPINLLKPTSSLGNIQLKYWLGYWMTTQHKKTMQKCKNVEFVFILVVLLICFTTSLLIINKSHHRQTPAELKSLPIQRLLSHHLMFS